MSVCEGPGGVCCAVESYLWDPECRSQQFEIMKSERPHTFGCRNKYGVVGDGEYRFMCILSSAKQSNFMGISLKWQRRKTLRNFY